MVRARVLLALAAVIILSMAVIVPRAGATEEISSFSVSLSTSHAGDHPDIHMNFALAEPGGSEVPRDIQVQTPEGIFGNPGAIKKCLPSDFALSECAPGAQLGTVAVKAFYGGDPEHVMGVAPVYNLEPATSDQTALFGFDVPAINIPIEIPVTVRTGSDYGLNFTVSDISQQVPLAGVKLDIWGTPAEIGHNTERFHAGTPGNPSQCTGVLTVTERCIEGPPFPEAGESVLPYVDNPSLCTGEPLPVKISVRTYQDPDRTSSKEATLPPTDGCERQRFDPFMKTALTDNDADSASGLDISLGADQFLSAAPTPSSIRSARLVLPEGFSINPDAADGQTSCSDAQAGFGSEAPSNCPDNSKVGTVEVITPALDGPLKGSLYIGEPQPGNQYRVFMIFRGFGLSAKIAAQFQPDPKTGQLTLEVASLPQVPFKEFALHLFASDRGLIATASHCTVYAVQANIVPWNNTLAPQSATSQLSVKTGPHGGPCPQQNRPFHPRLAAGTSNPGAGVFSDFHLKLDRDDGDQNLGDLDFALPPGFTGSLRGIPYCPESAILAAAANSGRAEQQSASCPAASQIGTSNVAAGPGDHPFNAVGKIYLSGPFKGAPLSLAAITPALAGPYDYGVVVVRVALHVDPTDAHVFAASDTVPSIIGGVPIRMRSIQVNIDRPNFTINPTNCDPFSVVSHGIGDEGASVAFSSPFQVINCATLPFKPRMSVKQKGGATRSKNPTLEFDLRTRSGDANLKSLVVTLPNAFEIDQAHLGNICSEKELAATKCAGKQSIGSASTKTPLLDQPLTGPVYAVSGSGGLPKLAFVLDGQVDLLPRAETKTVAGGRLATAVPVIPDAPIGDFHLKIFGGKHGYLANTRSLCARTPSVQVAFEGQNRKLTSQTVKVGTSCKKKKARRRRTR